MDVADKVGVTERVDDSEGVLLEVWLDDGVLLAVDVLVGELLGVTLGVGVLLAVDVRVGELLGVLLPLGVLEGVIDDVGECEGVIEGDGLLLGVTLAVGVCDGVIERVGVIDGLDVGENANSVISRCELSARTSCVVAATRTVAENPPLPPASGVIDAGLTPFQSNSPDTGSSVAPTGPSSSVKLRTVARDPALATKLMLTSSPKKY